MGGNILKDTLVLGIITSLLFVSVIPSTGIVCSITGRLTIYVDDDNTQGPWDGTLEHPYQYIQDGIDNAISGDTVFVFNGTYKGVVNVGKTLNLVGENRDTTIIYHKVSVSAKGVNISGFKMNRIYLHNDSINIIGNNISSGYGIAMIGKNILIKNNIISFNDDGDEEGISIIGGGDATIIDNIISNNKYGINICSEVNLNISGNNISHNDYGIRGLAMWGNCNISGNIFSKNNGLAIGMRDTYSCIIYSDNIFSDNGCGISLFNTIFYGGSIISGNNFTNNDIGVIIFGPMSNKIYSNNFIKNNVSATFRLLSLFNRWDGNYWDRPRLLPYPIIGCLGGLFIPIPSWVNFDWHPAQEPYDIGV